MGVEMCSVLFFFPHLRADRQRDTPRRWDLVGIPLPSSTTRARRVVFFSTSGQNQFSRVLPEVVTTRRIPFRSAWRNANFDILRARFTSIPWGFHLSQSPPSSLSSLSFLFLLVMTRGSTERILNLDNASFVLYTRLFSSRSSLPFRFLCRFAT